MTYNPRGLVSGHALIDLMHRDQEAAPESGSRVLCRHPFQESKRAYVIPAKVESLHKVGHSVIKVKG